MFSKLMESRSTPQRSPAGTLASFVLHTALIATAVVTTTTTAIAYDKPREERVRLVETVPDVPEEPKPSVAVQEVVIPAQPGFQLLISSPDVPLTIPPIDLSRPFDERDYSGRGAENGRAIGDSTVERAAVDYSQPFLDAQVEKPVQTLSVVAPRYPELLRSAGVEGTAFVQFIVDTLGRAEMESFKVLTTSHTLFGVSARNAIAGSRFLPAEVGGRKVRQLVQQPFVYGLGR